MNANLLPDFKILPYPETTSPQPEVEPTSKLTLNTSSSWTYCGPLLPLNARDLPPSFHTWAQSTIHGCVLDPLFSFLAFVHGFLETNGLSHYWITVRASQASSDFDVPRWHTDELFFAKPESEGSRSRFMSGLLSSVAVPRTLRLRRYRHPTTKKERTSRSSTHTNRIAPNPSKNKKTNPTDWKLTTTLLGPGTLFIPTKTSAQARAAQTAAKAAARATHREQICHSVRCAGCAMAAESVRHRLGLELEDHAVVQAWRGECVFLRIGEEHGAVHSEPVASGDRIFVNVVPGRADELVGLMRRWGMAFPRAWCVGLGG